MEGTVSRCGRPAAWLHSGATFRDCFDFCSDQLVSLSDIWESTHTHIYIYLCFFNIYIYVLFIWYTYIYIISILYVNNICTFKYIISIFSIFIWYKFIIDIVYTYYIYLCINNTDSASIFLINITSPQVCDCYSGRNGVPSKCSLLGGLSESICNPFVHEQYHDRLGPSSCLPEANVRVCSGETSAATWECTAERRVVSDQLDPSPLHKARQHSQGCQEFASAGLGCIPQSLCGPCFSSMCSRPRREAGTSPSDPDVGFFGVRQRDQARRKCACGTDPSSLLRRFLICKSFSISWALGDFFSFGLLWFHVASVLMFML